MRNPTQIIQNYTKPQQGDSEIKIGSVVLVECGWAEEVVGGFGVRADLSAECFDFSYNTSQQSLYSFDMSQVQAKQQKAHPHALQGRSHLPAISWTSLAEEFKNKGLEPSERYLHSATIVAGKLYVLGGADSKGPIKNNKLFMFDTATQKWSTIDSFNTSLDINAHVCALLRDELYFFGGNTNRQTTNHLHKFCICTKTWKEVQPPPNSHVPNPREQPLFTAVDDSFILLYGGINVHSLQLYNDAYLLREDCWLPVSVNNNLTPRIKMASALCNHRLFVFGGEKPSEEAPSFSDDLHQIQINDVQLQASFREVGCVGRRPARRTAHGMVAVCDESLIVYGGQGYGSKGETVALCDIWLFTLRELTWTELTPLEGPMPHRYQFSMSACNSQIYIFGGFNESHLIVDGFLKLEYLFDKKEAVGLCSECASELQRKVSKEGREIVREITVSTGFSYNLAFQVGFPFRAIQIIVDCAILLGASNLCISTTRTKRDIEVFIFEFDAIHHLSDQHFLDFYQTNDSPIHAKFIHQLKLGAFRLGKIFLYVSADEKVRKVLLASVDEKFSPNHENECFYLSYIQNIEQGYLLPVNAAHRRQTIFNILKSFMDDPNVVLSRREKHLLMVLEVNVFLTVEKAYYYELINYTRPENDLRCYYNDKKGELLQELGFSISRNPEFSLRSYLGIANLVRNINIHIHNFEDEPIDCSNYLEILRTYERASFVDEFECKLTNKYVESCAIFKCRDDICLEYNHGILIYCGNELFDRFKCPFGDLMGSKFYRKKYKRSHFSHNLFEFVGVLYLSEKMGLSRTKNKLKKQLQYGSIIQELSRFVKSLSADTGKVDHQLSKLYEMRFSVNRETSKRQKREAAQ